MTRRTAANPVEGQPDGVPDSVQPAAEPPAEPARRTAAPARRTTGRHALADRGQAGIRAETGAERGSAERAETGAERAETGGERVAVADHPADLSIPPADQPVPPTDHPVPPADLSVPPADHPTVPLDRLAADHAGQASPPAAVGVPNGAAPAALNGRSPAVTSPARQFRTRQPAGTPGRRRHAAVAGPGMLSRAVRWVMLLAITAMAVFGLRQYVIASYYIPSASMETTLHGCPGCQPDMVLVNKLSYRFKSVSRSDVVVFARPPQAPPEDKQLIKRVIGLPGDVVSGHDGHVFVNNKELVEPYVNPACHGTTDFAPVRVPTGRYFVMGDNRCDSFDSRMFGTIPRSAVIGQAFAVIWPVHHLRWL